MSHRRTSSAYRHWDQQWRTETGIAAWSQPEPWLRESVSLLRERHVLRVLDLGCGPGRNSIFLGEQGFDTYAVDASSAAVKYLNNLAKLRELPIDIRKAQMDELPFDDGHFDYVLAFNVCYHGVRSDVLSTIGEVRRVLRPGGIFQTTMLSKRNSEFGIGREIESDVFVQDTATDDKVHPHLYCDAAGVIQYHQGFSLLCLEDRPQHTPTSYHWFATFESNGEFLGSARG